jgi:hypothetical protein
MADLPRGTVTFLFTDIEGSTALWERDLKAMAVAGRRVDSGCWAIADRGAVPTRFLSGLTKVMDRPASEARA